MFTIKIADLLVEIDNRYDVIEKRCRDYIVMPDRESDIRVKMTYEMLEELLQWKQENDRNLSMGDLEFFSIHSLIYPNLPQYDAAWIHASAVQVNGEGYVLTAPSGYGKTTQAMLWLQYFGLHASIINGDNPIIRFIDGCWYLYGTPFGGSEGYQQNTKVPLRGICFLNHSEVNYISRMEPAMAFAQIIKVNEYHRMLSLQNCEIMMGVWNRIVEQIPVWQLHCNQSKDAVKTAYWGMKTE